MSNRLLLHPTNGTFIFGEVPEMNSRGIILKAGGIILTAGRHIGPNRGFGAAHIWIEHEREMAKLGLTNSAQVPEFVAMIIQVGTPLFFGGDSMRSPRLMAVRAATGMAILEFRERRMDPVWSVVTVYAGTKTHGSRVGTVR